MTGKEYNEQFSEEELKNEIWKDIPNYKGYYQASSLGRVRSLDRRISFIQTVNNKKYKKTVHCKGKFKIPSINNETKNFQVNLHKKNIGEYLLVHRVILFTFIGPCPEGMECCHNDGNPTNNRLSNLRWDTHINNEIDKTRHGTRLRGEGIGNSKFKERDIRNMISLNKMGVKQVDLIKMYNISSAQISRIINKKRWQHIN